MTDMKDQELRDILHGYRPQIDDNDAFMDKLMAQMDHSHFHPDFGYLQCGRLAFHVDD